MIVFLLNYSIKPFFENRLRFLRQGGGDGCGRAAELRGELPQGEPAGFKSLDFFSDFIRKSRRRLVGCPARGHWRESGRDFVPNPELGFILHSDKEPFLLSALVPCAESPLTPRLAIGLIGFRTGS